MPKKKPDYEPVLVDRVFDPNGAHLPQWRVFHWNGSQRVVLGLYTTKEGAYRAAARAEQ